MTFGLPAGALTISGNPMTKRIDQQTELAVSRFRTLISTRYDVAGAIVYGSRARGTHRPDSDADVAVLLR